MSGFARVFRIVCCIALIVVSFYVVLACVFALAMHDGVLKVFEADVTGLTVTLWLVPGVSMLVSGVLGLTSYGERRWMIWAALVALVPALVIHLKSYAIVTLGGQALTPLAIGPVVTVLGVASLIVTLVMSYRERR